MHWVRTVIVLDISSRLIILYKYDKFNITWLVCLEHLKSVATEHY